MLTKKTILQACIATIENLQDNEFTDDDYIVKNFKKIIALYEEAKKIMQQNKTFNEKNETALSQYCNALYYCNNTLDEIYSACVDTITELKNDIDYKRNVDNKYVNDNDVNDYTCIIMLYKQAKKIIEKLLRDSL